MQKLHYLKSSVTGVAAEIFKSFAIGAANYQLVWQALVGRYAKQYVSLICLLDMREQKRRKQDEQELWNATPM